MPGIMLGGRRNMVAHAARGEATRAAIQPELVVAVRIRLDRRLRSGIPRRPRVAGAALPLLSEGEPP